MIWWHFCDKIRVITQSYVSNLISNIRKSWDNNSIESNRELRLFPEAGWKSSLPQHGPFNQCFRIICVAGGSFWLIIFLIISYFSHTWEKCFLICIMSTKLPTVMLRFSPGTVRSWESGVGAGTRVLMVTISVQMFNDIPTSGSVRSTYTLLRLHTFIHGTH